MNILKKPLLTLKAAILSKKNQYGFIVAQNVNKKEIKKEIEKRYGIRVARVNTIRYVGKKINRHTQSKPVVGQRPGYKKAMVTLKPGEQFSLYHNA